MGSARRGLGAFAACAGIAIAATWPLVTVCTTRIVGDGGDSYQTLWGMRWIRDALVAGRNPFFTDRLYHPSGVSLVFQTFDLPSALLAVPLWDRVPEVAIYNAAVLFAFTVSAWGMFRLARELTGDAAVALAAGAIFASVPYLHAHLPGHLHLLACGWVPLYLVHVLRVVRGTATLRDGIAGGAFLALAALASWYHLVDAAVATAVLLAWTAVAERRVPIARAAARPALVGLLIFAASAGPLLAIVLRAQARGEVVGSHDPLLFSADLHAFVLPNAAQAWRAVLPGPPVPWQLNLEIAVYAGVVVVALALVGAAVAAAARPFLALAVVGAVLALGPVLQVGGRTTGIAMPYAWLHGAVPPLALSGVPVRFAAVMYLGLVAAAAVGLARLRAAGDARRRPLGLVAVALATAAALVEYRPRALPTWDYPVPPPMRAWAADPDPWSVLDDSDFYRPMWHATVHRKPMLGGYVSRAPKHLEDGLRVHPVIRAIVTGNDSHWFVRTDPRIDFDWAAGAPDGSFLPDGFAVTWTGTLRAPRAGRYELGLAGDGQAELFLGTTHVVRHRGPCPGAGPCESGAAVDLAAGRHPIQLTYGKARQGRASVRLWWRPPGGDRGVVPPAALQTPRGQAGLDGLYEQFVAPISGLGLAGGRAALRALAVRYVVTRPLDNACIQDELRLPLVYEGDGVRIYEVPAADPAV